MPEPKLIIVRAASIVTALTIVACGGSSEEARSPAASPRTTYGTTTVYYETVTPNDRTAPTQLFESRVPVADSAGSAGEADASYSWDKVDATYMSALRSFRGEVNSVVGSGEELTRTRQALHLLAAALEHVPGAKSVAVGAASSQIRDDASKLGPPGRAEQTHGAKRRTVKDALTVASERILSLANGPYGGDSRVLEAARSFERAVSDIPESDILWTNNSNIYKAFIAAETALRSMALAIADNRVNIDAQQ